MPAKTTIIITILTMTTVGSLIGIIVLALQNAALNPWPEGEPEGEPPGHPAQCSGNDDQYSFIAMPNSNSDNCQEIISSETLKTSDINENLINSVNIYTCPQSLKRIIISNGVPDHDLRDETDDGGKVCETKWRIELPLTPEYLGTNQEPPRSGIIAMALNGVPIFSSSGPEGNNVEPPEGVDPADSYWYGHPSSSGIWHYHNPLSGYGAFNQTENPEKFNGKPAGNQHIGYALDGFKIYGPVSNDRLSELDDCNGMFDGERGYHYHIRMPDQVDENSEYCQYMGEGYVTWRYVVGCYHGSLDRTVVGSAEGFEVPEDCVVEEV